MNQTDSLAHPHRAKIWKFAVISRVSVVILQILFNFLIDDHDAKVFNPPAVNASDFWLAKAVNGSLSGFRRWDAVYFLHIARFGYTYENTFAFQPIFPLSVGIWSTFLSPLRFILGADVILLLVAVLLNAFLFVKSALLLYDLGRLVVGDKLVCYRAALLFCITPSSVFMSAAYSETLYLYLTLHALISLASGQSWRAAFWFGLSTSARTNGIVNVGFICYSKLQYVVGLYHSNSSLKNYIKTLLSLAIQLCVAVLPFLLFQLYSYMFFCEGRNYKAGFPQEVVNYGKQMNFRMPTGKRRLWCNSTVPFIYNYIQRKHWNVGFLRYYQFKQIPNFVLAAPVAVVVVCLFVTYLRKNTRAVLKLGLIKACNWENTIFSNRCFPHVLHSLVLLVFGLLFMHVQVLTRILFSACPILYWFLAYVSTNEQSEKKQEVISGGGDGRNNKIRVQAEWSNPVLDDIIDLQHLNIVKRLVYMYFLFYFFLGIALHVNFLPWT